jgi:hypothetical protein
MAFTGQENHNISLADAAAWTKNYRKANPNAVQGHFFGKDAIAAILAQDSCVGMRIYYALDTAGVKQLIITGVTAEENDLYNGLLAERSIQCPPNCGGGNPLNG